MSSRYVVAAAAWVVGAAVATTGSVIAVNELAHGLLGQQTQQLVGTRAREGDATATVPASPTTPRLPEATSSTPGGRAATSATPAPAQASAGTFLSSPDGSVVASCQPGGAYLQYWSPDQGFEADDVARGPAAVATVSFRGATGGIAMRVSCTSGTPAARLVPLGRDE